MLCNSWLCEDCRPRRRARLLAEVASGEPTRFFTLTLPPWIGSSPEERRAIMAKGLSRVAQDARREWGRQSFEYLAVCESHLSGEPHIHVLQHGRFIPQKWLSAHWRKHTGGYIVDVRKVKGTARAVRYIAKYVAKSPEHFGFSKRYWQTRGYQLHRRPKPDSVLPAGGRVYRAGMTPLAAARILTTLGFAGKQLGGRWLIWTPQFRVPEGRAGPSWW